MIRVSKSELANRHFYVKFFAEYLIRQSENYVIQKNVRGVRTLYYLARVMELILNSILLPVLNLRPAGKMKHVKQKLESSE